MRWQNRDQLYGVEKSEGNFRKIDFPCVKNWIFDRLESLLLPGKVWRWKISWLWLTSLNPHKKIDFVLFLFFLVNWTKGKGFLFLTLIKTWSGFNSAEIFYFFYFSSTCEFDTKKYFDLSIIQTALKTLQNQLEFVEICLVLSTSVNTAVFFEVGKVQFGKWIEEFHANIT